MREVYTFPCGCQWPILQERPNQLPLMDFDSQKAPLDCPATWDILARGLTKGIFQLESPLGRSWTQKLKPENIEQLGALTSVLRPGCLQAFLEDNKSMTEHFCLRKNLQEDIKPYHPIVDKILNPTYNLLVYQEQLMALAKEVAGLDAIGVDKLRKAVGKKVASEITKCGQEFLEGCEKTKVVSKEQAEEIWSWIKASGRYAFNKSHAISYGIRGYKTAYIKAHWPLEFFVSWLSQAKKNADPRQEISDLVNDAKLFDIVVEPPDITDVQTSFTTDGKTIKFGMIDIKGIGEKQIENIKSVISESESVMGKKLYKWNWSEVLCNLLPNINSTAAVGLIKSGALRFIDKSRALMLAEYTVFSELKDGEQKWILKNYEKSLAKTLRKGAKTKKEGGACATIKRPSVLTSHAHLLENPIYPLEDTPFSIAIAEEELLGIPLTFSKIDSCDISNVNTTCKEIVNGKKGISVLGVQVVSSREYITKSGKSPGSKMGFAVISDSTGAIQDCVCFADQWKDFGHLFNHGNTLIVQGERDKKKGSFLIKKVWQAKFN